MSSHPPAPTAALDLLQSNIESLALEVTLRDLSSSDQIAVFLPALEAIRREAESRGMAALAQAADVVPASESAWHELASALQQLAASAKPTLSSASLNQDRELVADFILESREHLAAIEAQLLAVEQDPRNAEAINTIFRGFHTMKGLAGFLEFSAIQAFAHEVETLLELARNANCPVDSALIDIILQSADHMRHSLAAVEKGGAAPDAAALIARIRVRIADPASNDLVRLAEAVADPPPVQAAASAATASNPEATAAGPRSVKIDTGKLDYLVEMVGELAIAQAQVRHDPDIAALANPRIARNLGQLDRITAEVQRVAMTMRMIPVAPLFGRMARLVRDLARKSGKQANLELFGEDTELDRNMVEELADPLMHMIRNAVDHGAESPEARIAAGKNPAARLRLKAWHTGGFVNIGISDDGRGIVREKILAKARERGLIPHSAGANGENLSDQEVFAFIFEPGFSTAERLTDVSGRGVGMDVVRKQIAKLRGRIDIASRPGQGCTFTIKLPLTLAVIDGLIVAVGKSGAGSSTQLHRYIVPLFAVRETFRPAAEALSSVPDGGEMVLVRGSLLPILRLHRRFAIAPASEDASNGILIVIESDRRTFCVLVDELIGKQEVVIKGLGPAFRNVTGISGGCILGDGRVGLIIDVEGL